MGPHRLGDREPLVRERREHGRLDHDRVVGHRDAQVALPVGQRDVHSSPTVAAQGMT